MKVNIFPQNIPVMGIDVSKEKSDFCILDTSNSVIKRGIVKHTLDSMNTFLKILSEVTEKHDAKPICIMEATAYYHLILHKLLTENGYNVIVINPIQSGSIRNIDIRNIKNDKVDAYRIAYLYRLGKLKASNIPVGEISRLRSLCRFHIAMTNDITEHILRLRSYVDQSFPGFEKVFSKLRCKTPLAILEKYPTPKDILHADEKEIAELDDILKSKARVKTIIVKELKAIADKYGQPRRSLIIYEDTAVYVEEKETVDDFACTFFFTKEG